MKMVNRNFKVAFNFGAKKGKVVMDDAHNRNSAVLFLKLIGIWVMFWCGIKHPL